jgi:hypothetical protein
MAFEGGLPAPIPVTGTGSIRLPTGGLSGARRPCIGELLDAESFRQTHLGRFTGGAKFIESHVMQGDFDAGLDACERFRR